MFKFNKRLGYPLYDIEKMNEKLVAIKETAACHANNMIDEVEHDVSMLVDALEEACDEYLRVTNPDMPLRHHAAAEMASRLLQASYKKYADEEARDEERLAAMCGPHPERNAA